MDLEPIGREVRRELGRFGAGEEMERLVVVWPAAVGEAIAANAWPARFARDGTLQVATSSSTWAFELSQLEREIRGRLAAALSGGGPPRLRFAPGPLPERGAPEPTALPPKAPPVGDAERARGRHLAAEIDDDELRELVARAAAASLAGKADRRSFW